MILEIPSQLTDFVVNLDSLIQNRFLASITIFIIGLVLAKIISVVISAIAKRVAAKTKTELDDLVLAKISKPVFFILVLVVVQLALLPIPNTEVLDKIVNSLLIVLITYIVIVIFDIIIDVWARKFAEKTKSALDNAVLPLIHKFSKVFFTILGLIFIFIEFGVEVGPLLASLGIAGIAIAFALQNTLGNIFGGISIILDKSIKAGDVIQLEDKTSGKVLDVGLRSTKIRTFDNEVIIVPNGKLADSKIQNLALPDPSARVVIDFGVEYGSDTKKVREVVLEVIKKLDTLGNKDKAPDVWFMEMGDFSLRFRAIFWVKSYTERFKAKINANGLIYEALRKAKIGIPFPTSTVYMRKAK